MNSDLPLKTLTTPLQTLKAEDIRYIRYSIDSLLPPMVGHKESTKIYPSGKVEMTVTQGRGDRKTEQKKTVQLSAQKIRKLYAQLLDCAQKADEFAWSCDDRNGYIMVYTAQEHFKLPREVSANGRSIDGILVDFIDDAGLDVWEWCELSEEPSRKIAEDKGYRI